VVSITPQLHCTPGKDPVPILQEAGWAPGPVWMDRKSRPHRDSIPDCPARSSVTIPTELPSPLYSPHERVNFSPACNRRNIHLENCVPFGFSEISYCVLKFSKYKLEHYSVNCTWFKGSDLVEGPLFD